MPLMRVGDVELYHELVDFTEPWKVGAAPVVLVHGLGGDHSMWLYQVPELCHSFPTITLDLRGHGESTKPKNDFTMADLARDIVRLLRTLGVERAHMVGLSLGGMVVQQFALDYPWATASLVLADTLCGVPPEYTEVMRAAVQFIEQNSMAEIAKARITNAFSDAVDPALRGHFIDQVARNEKASYLRAAHAAFGFAASARLAEIAVPTLVMVGELDRVTPPPLSEDIARRIRGARLLRIAGAGHISNIERPVEFNRAVLEFLSGLEA